MIKRIYSCSRCGEDIIGLDDADEVSYKNGKPIHKFEDCGGRWVLTHVELVTPNYYFGETYMSEDTDHECSFCNQMKHSVIRWDSSGGEYGPHYVCRECLNPLLERMER